MSERWEMGQEDLQKMAEFCRAAALRYNDHVELLRASSDPAASRLAEQFEIQKAEAAEFASRLDDASEATVSFEPEELPTPGR